MVPMVFSLFLLIGHVGLFYSLDFTAAMAITSFMIAIYCVWLAKLNEIREEEEDDAEVEGDEEEDDAEEEEEDDTEGETMRVVENVLSENFQPVETGIQVRNILFPLMVIGFTGLFFYSYISFAVSLAIMTAFFVSYYAFLTQCKEENTNRVVETMVATASENTDQMNTRLISAIENSSVTVSSKHQFEHFYMPYDGGDVGVGAFGQGDAGEMVEMIHCIQKQLSLVDDTGGANAALDLIAQAAEYMCNISFYGFAVVHNGTTYLCFTNTTRQHEDAGYKLINATVLTRLFYSEMKFE